MKTNAAENNNCIKAIVTVKNLFFNYVSLTGLDIDLTVSSSERVDLFQKESVQISPCGFVCKCEEG